MDQLRIRFGSYVQVWEPSTQTNSMNMRRRGAIALGPSTTSTTSYLFLELDTGKIINQARSHRDLRELRAINNRSCVHH